MLRCDSKQCTLRRSGTSADEPASIAPLMTNYLNRATKPAAQDLSRYGNRHRSSVSISPKRAISSLIGVAALLGW